jgi:hypothetical protein
MKHRDHLHADVVIGSPGSHRKEKARIRHIHAIARRGDDFATAEGGKTSAEGIKQFRKVEQLLDVGLGEEAEIHMQGSRRGER